MIEQEQIISKEEILEALREVMDPEIPVLSVIDLGIIENVEIEDNAVTVKMIPTFTACPAIKIMQQQIKEKIVSLGFEDVKVIVDDSVSWNSDRMSEEAKRKLEKFGLGIPNRHGGEFSLEEIEHSKCPHCGSSDTTMNSLFGSTLCRSIHFCFDCKQSFERFKPL
ncbi:MAG TPA: 1,2-phenylacetyl-CoA epoxidase subunit PaaD [Chitinophagales bacterium]|nr:1,2-phenylacetyl-CoA epoxidase subunit PaaD [Chitinophagales bacterium]